MITYLFPFGKLKGNSYLLPAYGREGQGQHLFSWRRISQSEIRNSAAEKSESESEGGQKFLPPNPLPPHQNKFGTGLRFLPARAFSFLLRLWRSNQSEFRSKKVRTSFSNCEKRKGGAVRVQLSALQNQKTEDSSLFFGFRVYSNSFLYL